MKQPWPAGRDFRILSIDGGGIRGVFPAAVLAEFEGRMLGGDSVARYFDLAAGTSTGAIIALGLGAGKTAAEIRDMYMHRGPLIFPPPTGGLTGWLTHMIRKWGVNAFVNKYDREALQRALEEVLGDMSLGESRLRHVVPSFDGRFSEVVLFKTRHHDDYKNDWRKKMVDIAMATTAAPTIYPAFFSDGYTLIDGGIWANNPLMLAVVEAMICYEVPPERIKVLSIGCGDAPFHVSGSRARGGLLQWLTVIGASMRAQSLSATNQARLLLGPANVVRIEPALNGRQVALDDYLRAVDELLPAVNHAVMAHHGEVRDLFLREPAAAFIPVPMLTEEERRIA